MARTQGLTGLQRDILEAVNANTRTQKAGPTLTKLSEVTGLPTSTLHWNLRRLAAMGWVSLPEPGRMQFVIAPGKRLPKRKS